jgi:hypothetical protein
MPSDDTLLFKTIRDISGGLNTRQNASILQDNQMTVLYNVDIGIAGESSKRRGSVRAGTADVSNADIVCLHTYMRQGYSDSLLCYEDTNVKEWTGSGAWSAAIKADFTAAQTDVGIISAKEKSLVPDDIVIVSNGTDAPFRLHKDSGGVWAEQSLGVGATSPPKSTVMAWFGNRVWFLKNDLLYFSDAYDDDYATSFTSTNAYRVPVGTERKLLPTRDMGLIVMGEEAVWSLVPTTAGYADPTAVQPEPILLDIGIASKKGAVVGADDIYFFAHDGLRGLKRTQQDKLQSGQSYPISYRLKDEFERISWANIANLSMLYWDNKIIVSVPTSATAYDTWIYYPAIDSFFIITGWKPLCWEKFRVDNKENSYYGMDSDGIVYQAFTGYTDEGTSNTNGTAITYQEEGKEETLGQPLVKKNGGEIEIKASATGDYDLAISISIDGSDYQSLGTINLKSGAVDISGTVTLPFTLTELDIVAKKFHLDSYGAWKTIRLKIVHNATNGSDDIKIFERSIMAYQEEYESED